MIHLIFDTNIWIYFAEGQHPFVLKGIIDKVNNKDVILLVNNEIIKEWECNKDNSLRKIEQELFKQIRFAKELSPALNKKDRTEYKRLLSKITSSTPEFRKTIVERYNTVDDLIRNKSIKVPISKAHRLKVVELALNKKAPFHRNKNSVADALILLSSVDYIKNNGINNINFNRAEVCDSVFLSYNSDDFSRGIKGNSKDEIHPDLKPYLDSVGMTYERNFGQLLDLTSELIKILDDYLEFIESRIVEQIEREKEIKRGK